MRLCFRTVFLGLGIGLWHGFGLPGGTPLWCEGVGHRSSGSVRQPCFGSKVVTGHLFVAWKNLTWWFDMFIVKNHPQSKNTWCHRLYLIGISMANICFVVQKFTFQNDTSTQKKKQINKMVMFFFGCHLHVRSLDQQNGHFFWAPFSCQIFAHFWPFFSCQNLPRNLQLAQRSAKLNGVDLEVQVCFGVGFRNPDFLSWSPLEHHIYMNVDLYIQIVSTI